MVKFVLAILIFGVLLLVFIMPAAWAAGGTVGAIVGGGNLGLLCGTVAGCFVLAVLGLPLAGLIASMAA
jgi:hypothetical protein